MEQSFCPGEVSDRLGFAMSVVCTGDLRAVEKQWCGGWVRAPWGRGECRRTLGQQ